jgi:surfeit locus 1 family protein
VLQQKETTVAVPARSRSRTVLTALAVLLSLAILLTLGTWQVERLYWKEALLADIAERRAAAPVPLAQVERDLAAGMDIEYRRVSLAGTFDHARERHFFATFEGRTGFYVYTPLVLPDGRAIFVNRGFVPYEMKEPVTRQAGEVPGEQTITGYARSKLLEKPSVIVPDNDLAKNIFYWKDLDAMASSAGLSQVISMFVDADASVVSPGGWPKGGVTHFDLPNNHLQYAVTWYGLAVALLAVVFGLWWRSRNPRATGGTAGR